VDIEAFKRLWGKARPFALPAWLCFFALLCLTGLNPYFRPDYHDNITYFVAAESLLAGDGYAVQGTAIADWPPVTSLILAAVFAIFGTSIFAAKLVSIIAAIISVLLANRLLRREDRPDRLKSIALFTLTPVALLTATTVASDWICAAFSFGCLLVLWHLREKRSLSLAVAVGVLLGLSALTRQTGVLLGAAIVLQAFWLWRKNGFRAIVPECIATGIGASMYLAWGFYTAARVAKHPPRISNYSERGLELFTDFSFSELANSIFDLLWKWDDILERLGVPAGLATGLLIFPSLLLVIGVVSMIRKRAFHPSDLYALAFIALIFGYHWKMGRYLLPIAPFLILWFFAGLRAVSEFISDHRSLPHPRRDILVPTVAALWVAFLIPLNLYVLFNKSGNGAHRGISTLSNPAAADYYEARWADMHAGCEAIKQDGQPGAIAGSGFYLLYLQAFTGRLTTDAELAPNAPAAYSVYVADKNYDDPEAFAKPGDTKIYETDHVTVYRRARIPPPGKTAGTTPKLASP